MLDGGVHGDASVTQNLLPVALQCLATVNKSRFVKMLTTETASKPLYNAAQAPRRIQLCCALPPSPPQCWPQPTQRPRRARGCEHGDAQQFSSLAACDIPAHIAQCLRVNAKSCSVFAFNTLHNLQQCLRCGLLRWGECARRRFSFLRCGSSCRAWAGNVLPTIVRINQSAYGCACRNQRPY